MSAIFHTSIQGDVKGYPNVRYTASLGCHSSQYSMSPARKVGHVTIGDFRSWDNWTYTFYNKQNGELLGSTSIEVDHKNGEHQDPPSGKKPFEKVLAKFNRQAQLMQEVTND